MTSPCLYFFQNGLEYENADKRENNKTISQSEMGQSKRRNCQQKCFHSFNYVIDHLSIHFFLMYIVYTASCDYFCTTCCNF